MSKFDAAIKHLKSKVRDMNALVRRFEDDPGHQEAFRLPYLKPKISNYEAAIRVLEAAGKVDKVWACGDGPDDPEKAEAVSELLEALPDPGKEGAK